MRVVNIADNSWILYFKAEKKAYFRKIGYHNFYTLIFGPCLTLILTMYLTSLVRNRFKSNIASARLEKAHSEALEAKQFAELITKIIPDLIFIKNERSEIVNANPAFLNLYPEEIRGNAIGKTGYEHFPVHEVATFMEADKHAFERGSCQTYEDITPHDGQTRKMYTTKIKFFDRYGNPFLLGISRDVTDIVAAREEAERINRQMQDYTDKLEIARMDAVDAKERAEEADRTKSEFLANMSHELRTPMNGIIGMTDMLDETDATSEQKEYIDVLRNSAKSLLLIVNDILDLSKIESGNMVLEKDPFALKTSIHTTADFFKSMASKRGLVLSTYVDEDLPDFIEGDEGRFVQILRNLIGNAVKFTDAGEIRIEAKYKDDSLLISVKDTGIGIPEDQIKKVFDKFNQANNTSSRKYGGTGLGLSITKQLVELMGGEIWVESLLKKGTTFWIQMPIIPREDIKNIVSKLSPAHSHSRPSSHHVEYSYNKNARILIAEDHPTNQFLIKKLMHKFGFKSVETAENGEEAVQLHTVNEYDLILMDCQMPEMDGYEATKRIRTMQNGDKRIPIIAMTANAMVGDREKCLAHGMDDYISKPIDPKKLMEILSFWIPTCEQEKIVPYPYEHEPQQSKQEYVVLNFAHLESFTDGDIEMEEELFKLFLKESDISLNKLRHFCECGSNSEWKEAAHKYKGAAANLGAETLSAMCFWAEKGHEENSIQKQKYLMDIEKAHKEVSELVFARLNTKAAIA